MISYELTFSRLSWGGLKKLKGTLTLGFELTPYSHMAIFFMVLCGFGCRGHGHQNYDQNCYVIE